MLCFRLTVLYCCAPHTLTCSLSYSAALRCAVLCCAVLCCAVLCCAPVDVFRQTLGHTHRNLAARHPIYTSTHMSKVHCVQIITALMSHFHSCYPRLLWNFCPVFGKAIRWCSCRHYYYCVAPEKLALLNAKPENVRREAQIIAQAGLPGAVTIATNMAGRGTDIVLGGNPKGLALQVLMKIFARYFLTGLPPSCRCHGSCIVSSCLTLSVWSTCSDNVQVPAAALRCSGAMCHVADALVTSNQCNMRC